MATDKRDRFAELAFFFKMQRNSAKEEEVALLEML